MSITVRVFIYHSIHVQWSSRSMYTVRNSIYLIVHDSHCFEIVTLITLVHSLQLMLNMSSRQVFQLLFEVLLKFHVVFRVIEMQKDCFFVSVGKKYFAYSSSGLYIRASSRWSSPVSLPGFASYLLLYESRYVEEMMFIRSHNLLLFTKLQPLKNLKKMLSIIKMYLYIYSSC